MRESGPLQIVARTNGEPGTVATRHILVVHARLGKIFLIAIFLGYGKILFGIGSHLPDNVANAAAHLDSVGSNHALVVLRQIRKHNHIFVQAFL